MQRPPQLPSRPTARTEKVEDLVEMVYRGRIRVPWFQRPLNWEAKHVQELFDSIYRGYPVGSLLFYRRAAPAARLRVGPIVVDAAEEPEAWFVVDGQQRLTSLTACLRRPTPLPERPRDDDPFVLFFDVENQAFVGPPAKGDVPSTWVPLPKLLEAADLTEWAFGWAHGRDPGLRRLVFEAGARIREYSVPLYLIETEDPAAAEQIYYRSNQAGKPLRWTEVYKALFGRQEHHPSTLADLGAVLAEVGMGRLSEDRLLTSLFGLRGLDPTRSLDEHYRKDPTVLGEAVSEAVPVLRRALSFLRHEARIPHLRLLPKPILLDVLTRFFALHSDPSPRSRLLLSRWFWRTVLGAGAFDDRTLRRRGIRSIRADDEEASVQGLLALVDGRRHRPFELPAAFDGRSDDNRIVLATLAHLRPRHLETGRELDVAALVEGEDTRGFAKIVRRKGSEDGRSPANRMLHPKGAPVKRLLLRSQPDLFGPSPVASSHAISEEALGLLAGGDDAAFLARRSEDLTDAVRRFAARMAAWDQSDRPSIDYILREAGSLAS